MKLKLSKAPPGPGFPCSAQGELFCESDGVDTRPEFDGPEYSSAFDKDRLTGQLKRIWDLMNDGAWRTYGEIADVTGDPEASISAQLRHLRKPKFGSHTVNRRARGDRSQGLFEYQLILNESTAGALSVQS